MWNHWCAFSSSHWLGPELQCRGVSWASLSEQSEYQPKMQALVTTMVSLLGLYGGHDIANPVGAMCYLAGGEKRRNCDGHTSYMEPGS